MDKDSTFSSKGNTTTSISTGTLTIGSRRGYENLPSVDDDHSDNIEFTGRQQQQEEQVHQFHNNDNNDNEIIYRISIDDAIEKLGFGKFQYYILISSGLCFAADAMQVILLSFITLIIQNEWKLSINETSFITSILFVGAMVGTLLLGPLADHIGRKPIFLLAAFIISTSGFITSIFVTNYIYLLLGIFNVGIGVGGLTVPFDILAEFLPKQHRGTQLLLIEYFWTFGCLYVVCMAYMLLDKDIPQWRIFIFVCTIPCFISLVIGYMYVPESIRWLTSKGKLDDAIDILHYAAKRNGLNVDDVFPSNIELLPEPDEKHASISDLFQPKWREITIRLWCVWSAMAFGYYGVLLANTRVFASTSNNDNDNNDNSSDNYADNNNNDDVQELSFDYTAIFVSSMAEFVGTTLVILTVDNIGRIKSQVTCYTLAGIFVCLLCILASNNDNENNNEKTTNTSKWLLLVSLGFGARVFEMAATCVTWVSTAEILTTEVRSTGHSTANAMGRVGAFFSPFLVEGDTPFVRIGIIMLLVHCFTAICVSKLPETTGREMGITTDQDNEDNENDDDDEIIRFPHHALNGEIS